MPLEFVEYGDGGGAVDVTERIEAGGAPIGGEWIEQVNRLTCLRPEARRRVEILPLHVEDHDGVRPGQQIGDHHPDALAGPGGRIEHDMLRAVADQQGVHRLADQDAGFGPQTMAALLAGGRPACSAMQGATNSKSDRDGEDQQNQAH